MSGVLEGQFRFLELLQDLVLFEPHWLDSNPILLEYAFVTYR
jgi:hypothetical protein